MMEKELAGSNSLLSSSNRQCAAVRANLLPIWRKKQTKSKFLIFDNYQYSGAVAVDELSFDVFIPKKCSNPGVSIGLDTAG